MPPNPGVEQALYHEHRGAGAGGPLTHPAFARVLRETIEALQAAGIEYLLIGGLASTGFGRPRATHDIDLFVKPHDADRVLEVLEARGFRPERTNPNWLYKAFKDGMMVDVIFQSSGLMKLDAEMLARSTEAPMEDYRVRFIPPEDLLVMKVIANDEENTRHWYDALGVVAGTELDWEYLLRRARRGPRRVLSLLIYAQSVDLMVPDRVIRALVEQLYE